MSSVSEIDSTIQRLAEFKDIVREYFSGRASAGIKSELRSRINQKKKWVRQLVIEKGCFQTVTIGPPPAVGGILFRDGDPFDIMFDPPYGQRVDPLIIDMIDETIGALREPPKESIIVSEKPFVELNIRKGFAFIAMPMNATDGSLDDVLDSIKEACSKFNIQAERVDEDESNDRITDRILSHIREAEYVIVDLTHSRPNVYYEAGYAQALLKTPIYIAKDGTKLEFDLKDYPVLFFTSLRDLKQKLGARLQSISSKTRK